MMLKVGVAMMLKVGVAMMLKVGVASVQIKRHVQHDLVNSVTI